MAKTQRLLCSPTTINKSVNFLNSELNILDFKAITVHKDDKDTLAQLVNVCYQLALTVKDKNLRINELKQESYTSRATLKSEMQCQLRTSTLLSNEIGKVDELKTKLKNSEEELDKMTKRVKTLKREVELSQKNLSVQKLKHEHEIRRKDVHVAALKKKIYDHYSNESGGFKSDRVKSNRDNKILPSQFEEIFDKYVCQLHDNVQVLVTENAEYRSVLETIYEKVTLEIIHCPEVSWKKFAGLSCHDAVDALESNFNIFIDHFLVKDTG